MRKNVDVGPGWPGSRPFVDHAVELLDRGLAIMPLGKDDGKRPLVDKWNTWRNRPGPRTIAKWFLKFPLANIGARTGRMWGWTVVDVDDAAALVSAMLERCGWTPLQIATPRGGRHLWYRSAGERNVQALDRLKVDVRGEGGYVVLPPSISWAGDGIGRSYRLISGSWEDLDGLPCAWPGSLPLAEQKRPQGRARTLSRVRKEPAPPPAAYAGLISFGARTGTLLALARWEARSVDGETALLEVAHRIVAERFDRVTGHPFTDAEISRIVHAAWTYELTHRNSGGGTRLPSATTNITISALDVLALEANIDAQALWLRLAITHRGRRDTFAVSPKAMAEVELIHGWTCADRYRNARDWLLQVGGLVLAHKGGRRPGDPNLYLLGIPQFQGVVNLYPILDNPPPPPKDLPFFQHRALCWEGRAPPGSSSSRIEFLEQGSCIGRFRQKSWKSADGAKCGADQREGMAKKSRDDDAQNC